MALETASYVGDLVATNPTSTDPKSQGDDHLRLLKSVLLSTFVGLSGTAIVTGEEAQGDTENDFVVTVSPEPDAYYAGTFLLFVATHTNSGPCAVKIGSLAAKGLVTVAKEDFASGDVVNGSPVLAVYDGATFVVVSGQERIKRAGDTYSGSHDFTSATVVMPQKVDSDSGTANDLTMTGSPTAPTPDFSDSSTRVATTRFVDAVAFSAALPAQSPASAGMAVVTDGDSADWGTLPAVNIHANDTLGGF